MTYDPCSYPRNSMQILLQQKHKILKVSVIVKHNVEKKIIKIKVEKGIVVEISFMIFRTGSILIVGHCEEDVLYLIYEFLKIILAREYYNIKTHI